MKKLLVICGATASGKTSLAVECAKRLNGEVISCDALLVYRGLNIGTAKPTREEMGGIEHHLIDVADRGFLNAIHRGMGYTGERYDAIERSVRERLTEYDPNSVLACGAREDELEIDIRYLSKMLYDGTDLSASRILALLREFYAESGVTDWEPLAGAIAADLGTAPLSDNGTSMSADTLDFTDLFA